MNVLKYDVNVPLFILKFEEHKDIKDKLLDLISKQRSISLSDHMQNISNTDWDVDNGERREYFDYLLKYMDRYVYQILEDTGTPGTFDIFNVWFQQYHTKDNHHWHSHGGSVWSGVYYLELPKDGPGTTFSIPFMKGYYTPPIEEGDILLFPSCLIHRSEENMSNSRKTVIVFNVNHK